MLSFRDIPKFTPWGNYACDVSWSYLKSHLERLEDWNFNSNPDFQRAHVWNQQQKERYVEFILQGGRSGKDLLLNHPRWNYGTPGKHELVLVDGKQRLDAVLQFLDDKIEAFGQRFSEFGGRLNMLDHSFRFHVNDLKTRREVLQWYLDINTGGVVHTNAEIERVRAMLAEEEGRDD